MPLNVKEPFVIVSCLSGKEMASQQLKHSFISCSFFLFSLAYVWYDYMCVCLHMCVQVYVHICTHMHVKAKG